MINLKNDIESLRSLSQIFSPSNFSRIIRKNDCSSTKERILKHICFSESLNYGSALQYIYKQLQLNYKNEYLYKNSIINKLLIGRYSINTTTAINELKIGDSIADLALLNGEAKIFEIKTEYDSLKKLEKQISDYIKFANKVYVVANSKFIDKLLNNYRNTTIGIIEFTENNTLREIVPAKGNYLTFDHLTIFKLLRKKEYLDIIDDVFGFIPDVPNTMIFKESLEMIKAIDVVEFQELAYNKLKERKLRCPKEFLSSNTPYELKHICYSLDMSNKDYSSLYQFLNKEI